MQNYICELPNHDLANLEEIKGSLTSYQTDRVYNSPQKASLEEQDGADTEPIFAALIHDVGNALAPENHSQVSSTIIQPFCLDKVTWILQVHGPFQMFSHVDKFSLEKDGRDIYSEHKLFNSALKFCQKRK